VRRHHACYSARRGHDLHVHAPDAQATLGHGRLSLAAAVCGPPIPDDLIEAYHEALARIPAFASSLLTADLNEVELRVILAACASAKGFSSIGEAITELTPQLTTQLLEDWRYQ
jgi:hypothetical protein